MQDIEKLKRLRDLALNDQPAFLELLKANPEVWESLIAEDRRNKLMELAREDNLEGALAWHELKFGAKPLPHVGRWLKRLFEGKQKNQGVLFFGFRASRKTVTFSTEFERQIGLHPEKSNLIVAASGSKADDVANPIARTIEHHPAWKMVFPHIVKGEKWGAEGYFVRDDSISDQEWAKKTSTRLDPTLIAAGYDSHLLNGRHPNGILYVDDVHDLKNSSSELERRRVVETFTSTLLKTVIREGGELKTAIWCIGTPWDYDDVYHYLKNTGEFLFDELKAMLPAKEGEGVYCDGVSKDGTLYEDVRGWWIPQTEHYAIGDFMADRAILGKSRFYQMIQLDLAKASSGRLKYYEYPAEEITRDLYTVGGCDPTNFEPSVTGNRNSYFTLAYVSKLPTGGAVIVDGILEQCTQLQAENYILAAQSMFSNWQFTAVEDVSVGRVFRQNLERNPNIRVIKSGLKNLTDGRITSKHDRVTAYHRYFESGAIKISDADTPFLNALRRLFDKFFDLDASGKDYSFDAFDAVFHALRMLPDVTSEKRYGAPGERKARVAGPLDSIGLHIGYGSHG